jgi:peptide-methionine (S)-S-oxide reductase
MPDQATFALGCFWHPEVVFRNIEGVIDAEVGYTGGHTVNPSYEQVCSGATGHAEAVRITYDPQRVTYERLLDVFFSEHDPTQENRQGPDVGTQYRSAVYFHDDAQRKAAERAVTALQSQYPRSIATEIRPAGEFYRAEEYHQQYLVRRGLATCRV